MHESFQEKECVNYDGEKKISRRDEWWRVIEGCRRQKVEMADETSNEELLKAVKRIKSPLFEFEFQTVGPLKRWKKKCGGKTTVCSTLERILPTFTRWLWRCWNHSAHNVPAAQAIMPVPQPAPTQETLEVNIHLHFSCRFSFCITYFSSIISLPSSRRLPTSTFVSFVVLLARVILH